MTENQTCGKVILKELLKLNQASYCVVQQVWTSMKTSPDIHQKPMPAWKKVKSHSVLSDFCNPPWTIQSMGSPCWNTGVGNLFFLQNASMRVRIKTQIHGSMSNTLKKKKCLAKRKVLQYFRGNIPLKLTLSLYCQPYITWPSPDLKLIYIKLFQDCKHTWDSTLFVFL